VTGGNGFIGRSLIPLISRLCANVTIVDSSSASVFAGYENVTYENYDFLHLVNKPELLADHDVLIHLAAFLGVDNCEASSTDTLLVNGINSCSLFQAAKQAGMGLVLYTSSSEVYGDLVDADESSRVSPKSDYGIAKLFAERYLSSLSSKSFKAVSFRLFSIYGALQRNDFVIPKFVDQVKSDKPITVYGDGTQLRAFCHVTDAVHAIIKTLKISRQLNEYTLLNVGNDSEPLTILELAKLVQDVSTGFGYNATIEQIPLSQTIRGASREVYKRVPNITKARELLRYEPMTTLRSGIESFF